MVSLGLQLASATDDLISPDYPQHPTYSRRYTHCKRPPEGHSGGADDDGRPSRACSKSAQNDINVNPATAGMSHVTGTIHAVSNGNAAPTINVLAEENAA